MTRAVPGRPANGNVLIVVPTLNEADHIGSVIDRLCQFLDRAAAWHRNVLVVIADGGSTDGTREIVAAHPLALAGRVVLLANPARLQSAAVNLAVARFGCGMDWLIRMDAHAVYPADYCDILLQEAGETAADSVVVSMRAVGRAKFQRAAALAQNGRFGNGGAPHRNDTARGRYVDHGHHALIRLDAFRSVGGYDATFSHNEDSEFDHRLVARGGRIWLTGRTGIDYLPRQSIRALVGQYLRFGRGRARTFRKHRLRPGFRQLIVMSVMPAVTMSLLAPIHPGFALPAALWVSGCLTAGLALATFGRHGATGLAAGAIAGAMHLAWSAGFWSALIGNGRVRPAKGTLPGPHAPARSER